MWVHIHHFHHDVPKHLKLNMPKTKLKVFPITPPLPPALPVLLGPQQGTSASALTFLLPHTLLAVHHCSTEPISALSLSAHPFLPPPPPLSASHPPGQSLPPPPTPLPMLSSGWTKPGSPHSSRGCWSCCPVCSGFCPTQNLFLYSTKSYF